MATPSSPSAVCTATGYLQRKPVSAHDAVSATTTTSANANVAATAISDDGYAYWSMGGSLAVVRSYAPGCEPLVTGNLAMGLTIRSSHKQELSSVYQFIDVLYSLCIYEALRH